MTTQSASRLSVPDHRREYGDVPGWAVPTLDPRKNTVVVNGLESMSDRHLHSVPDWPVPDVYGHIDFWDGTKTRRLSIDVEPADTDIVLSRNGWVVKHPFDHPRDSTEEERAAVGWTW